jgi:GAF domain-containing protein
MIYWINSSGPVNEAGAAANGIDARRHVRGRWRAAEWAARFSPRVLVAVILLSWLAVAAVRMLFSSTHPRPDLRLDEDLAFRDDLPFKRERFSLPQGSRLTRVNGDPVSRIEELSVTAARTDDGHVIMTFETPDESHPTIEVSWRQSPRSPNIDIGADMRLRAASGAGEHEIGATVAAVNGQPVTTHGDIERVLARVGGKNPSLLLAREDGTRHVLAYTVIDWSSQASIYFVGLATALCAIAVIWIRRTASGAWSFFWFTVNLAILSTSRALPIDYRGHVEDAVYVLSQLCLPFTSIAFLFNLSPLKSLASQMVSRRATALMGALGLVPAWVACHAVSTYSLVGLRGRAWPLFFWLWLAPLVLALAMDRGRSRLHRMPAYACYGLSLSLSLGLASLLFLPPELAIGVVPYPVFAAWQVWTLGLALLGLVTELPVRLEGIPLSALDRQRAGMLRSASVCAFLPLSVYIFIRTTSFNNLTQPRLLVELSQVAFPGLMAIGIVRQNVLDLSRIVREALASVFLLVIAIVGYGLLWTSAIPALTQVWRAPLGFYNAVFTILLALSVLGLQYALRRNSGGNSVLAQNFEEHFMDRFHEASSKVNSINEVYDFVASEFSENLGVSTLHLLLSEQALSRHTDTGMDGLGATEAWTPELEAVGTVLECVGATERVLFTSDVEEAVSTHPAERALDALHQLGATVGFPLRDGTTLVGALLLGRTQSNRNLSPRELRFVERTVGRLGASLRPISLRAVQHRGRIVDRFPEYPPEIAGYKIMATLGQGGMSYVYLGQRGNMLAAIKVANHTVQASPVLRTRFEREAQILRELVHPNVVRLVEQGYAGTEPFIALEYMSEGSLRDELARFGPFDAIRVAQILDDSLCALEYASSKRIIHRDIKPANLYLSPSGRVKVGDFGIGRIEDDDSFTLTGERLGTLAYMPPESMMGDGQDWTADQYALGVTAFELLTGHRPFEAKSLGAQVAAKLSLANGIRQTIAERTNKDFSSFVMKMIAPRPEHRFSDYGSLRQELSELFGDAIGAHRSTVSRSGFGQA